MGYSFTIGKAVIVRDVRGWTDGNDPQLWPTVRAASQDVDDPPHADEYEGTPHSGSSDRSISYSTWMLVRNRVTTLDEAFDRMECYVEDEDTPFIPVQYYEDDLPIIDDEARTLLEGEPRLSKEDVKEGETDPFKETVWETDSSKDAGAALRALWFVRWSVKSKELYGEFAAFKSPSEWR